MFLPMVVLMMSQLWNQSAMADDSLQTDPCDFVSFSEKDVVRFIFANYSKYVRPKINGSEAVTVTISLRIIGVHDLLEREGVLILDAYLATSWSDDYLIWEKIFPYSCVFMVLVRSTLMWLPDVSVTSSPSGMYSLIHAPGCKVVVSNYGSIFYSPAGQIASRCKMDVTYFPFDQQECRITLESWNYDTTQQVFKASKRPFQVVHNSWTENAQWLIVGNSSEIKAVSYFSGSRHYSRAIFTLTLKRKSLFYIINVIIPSLIISVVELATFSLPLDEVTKVLVSFTCLLAYSVFQKMVIADLPRSGDSVPMLSLYIDLQMGYIGIIALMGETAVFLAIRQMRFGKTCPKWLLTCFKAVGFLLGIHECRNSFKNIRLSEMSLLRMVPGAEMMKPSNPTEQVEKRGPEDKSAEQPGTPTEEDFPSKGDWFFIAKVVERLNIILYTAAIVITPIVMFNCVPY